MHRIVPTILTALAISGFIGCDRSNSGKTSSQGGPAPQAPDPQAKSDDHDHSHDDHDHGDHGHGESAVLGSAAIGSFQVRAIQVGDVVEGKDASFEIDLTTVPAGASAADVVVRVWIGTENAEGSIKAKADIESAADPTHRHAHAEVPSPLPSNSRLWVELDHQSKKSTGSFVLKR